jgi:hypothetical protein
MIEAARIFLGDFPCHTAQRGYIRVFLFDPVLEGGPLKFVLAQRGIAAVGAIG